MSTDSSLTSDPATSQTWTRSPLHTRHAVETDLTYAQLRTLANQCGGRRVSIAMPTHGVGPQTRQDRIRLAALTRRARVSLGEAIGDAAARRFVGPLNRLVEGPLSWAPGYRGLVFLLDERDLRAFAVRRPLTPVVHVGERFRILPLLPMLAPDHFWLLAVSPNDVRLFEGDRDQLRQLPRGDLPRNLQDVVGHDIESASLQFHSAGPSGHGAIFHGQGAGQDDRDHEREQFLRSVVDALTRRLAQSPIPIVVAAVERTVADVRRLASQSHLRLAAAPVLGNPSDSNLADLHAAAWASVEPELQAHARAVAARIEEQRGTRRVVSGVAPVLDAARMGRVEAMVVTADVPVWGRAGSSPADIECHEHWREGDTDLVDLAVAHALTYGSEVHLRAADTSASRDRVAAVLRY